MNKRTGSKSRRVSKYPTPYPSAHEARVLLKKIEFGSGRRTKGQLPAMTPLQLHYVTQRWAWHAEGAKIEGDVVTHDAIQDHIRREHASLRLRQPNEVPAESREIAKNNLASAYFKRIGDDEWWVIGSGAPYGDGILMNPKLERILASLKSAGIPVSERSMGFPGSCDSFTFTARFSGGLLEVTTGNYFGRRGGSVRGVDALRRLLGLMGLQVTAQTARRWNLERRRGGMRLAHR